jgi:protein-disulfide isomerase
MHQLRAIVVALLMILLPAVVPTVALCSKGKDSPLPTEAELLQLRPGDLSIGSLDAPIKVIEYQAVTCPHCSYFDSNVLPQIREHFIDTKKVLYVMREYPVDEQSFNAALMMRCMKDRTKALQFRAVLLSTQKDWWGKRDYMDIFKKYATLGGMNEDVLMACAGDNEVKEGIFRDKLEVMKVLNVHNIPSFIVMYDGHKKRHEGAHNWEYWENMLNGALEEIKQGAPQEVATVEAKEDMKEGAKKG